MERSALLVPQKSVGCYICPFEETDAAAFAAKTAEIRKSAEATEPAAMAAPAAETPEIGVAAETRESTAIDGLAQAAH